MSTTELVPGDIICIEPEKSQVIHCDAVLIEGTCSMDESMLTGESHPISKVQITK
jgi:P-type E1-E2 ATPase